MDTNGKLFKCLQFVILQAVCPVGPNFQYQGKS